MAFGDKIQVLQFKTGDGRVRYTREIAGEIMRKLVYQAERRYNGIRELQMVQMWPTDWDNLPDDQKLTLLITN